MENIKTEISFPSDICRTLSIRPAETMTKLSVNTLLFLGKIKNVIKLTLLSVRKKLNKRERQFCFEIFGYDFMVDSKCKPWLI